MKARSAPVLLLAILLALTGCALVHLSGTTSSSILSTIP